MEKWREKYLRRARIAGRVLRFVPFLRMAGFNGSLVRGEGTRESDIDFLIIVRAGRLYTARFVAAILIQLTGWRRHGKHVAGRICLNCFLSDDNPDILPKDPKSWGKVARAYLYTIPLVDSSGDYENFMATNKWMGDNVKCKNQNAKLQCKIKNEEIQGKYFGEFPKRSKKYFEKMLTGRVGDFIEKKLMNSQKKRILRGVEDGDEIVATVREIRLHPKKG